MSSAEGQEVLPGSGRGTPRKRADVVPLPTEKHGFSGTPVNLAANYFTVQSIQDCTVYQYDIKVDPEIESLSVRKGLLRDHQALLGKHFLFDGMALWIPTKLQKEVTELYSKNRRTGVTHRITIKMIGEINRNDPIVLQICNIQLRKNFSHLNLNLMGRNYFDPRNAFSVPQHKLELWPGYATSIRQHETMPLMCVDLVFKVVRQDTVLQAMETLYKADRNRFQQEAVKKFVGAIILTKYNNRTYRIDDIDWNGTPRNTFKQGDVDVSYVDYYEKHWGLKITDLGQPLLISRPKAREIRRGQIQNFVLIPELCTMTGLDEATRSNYNVMRDVAIHTRVDPDKRVKSLLGYMKRMEEKEEIQSEMRYWGFEYGRKLVELQGRILPRETILLAQNSVQYQESSANWIGSLRDSALLSAVRIKKWLLLLPRSQAALADTFTRTLVRVSAPMRIQVSQPERYLVEDDRTATLVQTLQRVLDPLVELVVIIVSNNRKDRYDAIKKICCIDHPVASQVILSRTISNPVRLMTIVTNIVLQINCKLGGELWSVQIPLKNLMVAGFDTYHDSSQRGKSVGAVVCSTNDRLTRYYSRTTFQANHQELADSLATAFTAGLKTYHAKNGQLPDRIVFYRDGVGDGQIPAVKTWELTQLMACFKAVACDYNPKFAFVVVNKRINTRLFAKQGHHAANPLPGTLVDDVITRPERYDFFLVSQSVRQGTVAPTQYNVVHDTTLLKPDHMQRLTYKLTHLYYNWPGTVRVPAPCQYAHKLALLVGDSLHRDPHPDLAETLYYL